MSKYNRSRKWRRIRRVTVLALVTTAAAVSTVSARSSAGAESAQAATALHRLFAFNRVMATAAAAPPAGQMLGGFTSQGWPVVLDLSGNGKRIARVAVGLDMRCTSGGQLSIEDWFARVPIGPNGKVRLTFALSPTGGPPPTITGGSDSFTGRLDRKRLTFSGAWQLHLNVSTTTGQTDQCDSGRVTFSARL